MNFPSSAIDTSNMEMTVIESTETGLLAKVPAKFAAKWSGVIRNSIVMQAHRGGTADRATCAAVGATPFFEDTE